LTQSPAKQPLEVRAERGRPRGGSDATLSEGAEMASRSAGPGEVRTAGRRPRTVVRKGFALSSLRDRRSRIQQKTRASYNYFRGVISVQ
jgi:hypothetical protein